MKLNRLDFIEAGWANDHRLDLIMNRASLIMQEKGISDVKYVMKLLRREFPDAYASLSMRGAGDAPVVLSEAIVADTESEHKNLQKVRSQMQELMRCPVVVRGSLMPDACPVGGGAASMPVGGVVVAENAIIPAAHSSDICCSMFVSFYRQGQDIDSELNVLEQATRFGPGVRSEPVFHEVLDEPVWSNPFLRGLEAKALGHMADQGDGNHFAYLGCMEVTQTLLSRLNEAGYAEMATALLEDVGSSLNVLVTHHGSRGLGSVVYGRGLEAAVKMTARYARGIPEEAAWIYADSSQGQDYWQALQYLSRWTRANHASIHQRFLDGLGQASLWQLGNQHNFVWQRGREYVHGKGATPAWKDDSGRPRLGLIPLNMAEPVLLVLGGDQQEFNSFAPHGAGRNLSRRGILKQYKRRGQLDLKAMDDEMKRTTQGIKVRWYQGQADITETPVGYKPAAKVMEQIETFALASVLAKIEPRGCMMAGRKPAPGEKPLSPKQIRQRQHRAERRRNNQRNWMDDHQEDQW
ncbi:RtcB family protein [Verrucomicrobiaceae bacterium N1E253]|uniref:3'-phosphate/5'-hydroxy nucleic acid ligase n=1 Tax=Oceaniferula marina TaxID=2748318 RepID=A0A851GHU8_9BACT|nr:RtcB family protein [Oceaniferula marina]NWK56462.1 RtcB family protein [Oceaniferula marina]